MGNRCSAPHNGDFVQEDCFRWNALRSALATLAPSASASVTWFIMDASQLPFPSSFHTMIPPMTLKNFREKANFIRQVADDTLRVRGAFKVHEYRDVNLPFVVLRRLDLVREPKKDHVIKQFEQFKDSPDEERLTPILRKS